MIDKIEYHLHNTFGHSSFRPKQEDIVRSIYLGNDVLAVLPTGAGKSLCFQLPAVCREGTTIVISPLISLMKDQVDNANQKGIKSILINSELSTKESEKAYFELKSGIVKLLYIAPERFANFKFMNVLPSIKLAAIIVDESHTVEWGYDFRPAYLKVAEYLKGFTGCPRAAFTASATKGTQIDIIRRFGLRNPIRVQASFNRPNLSYEVIRKNGDGMVDVLEYIKKNNLENSHGIIYRSTRNKVEDTAELISRDGILCLPYHAGMKQKEKNNNQEMFSSGKAKWICATIAFGMGIDISDIRNVIHADIPKNMEGFYQETGRSGRDGKHSMCTLFYSYEDIKTGKYFIEKNYFEHKNDNRWKQEHIRLNYMRKYAESDECRRKTILNYFGETYQKENCASCDVCLKQFEKGRFHRKIYNKTLF